MARITISELRPAELDYNSLLTELSPEEIDAINGGGLVGQIIGGIIGGIVGGIGGIATGMAIGNVIEDFFFPPKQPC